MITLTRIATYTSCWQQLVPAEISNCWAKSFQNCFNRNW